MRAFFWVSSIIIAALLAFIPKSLAQSYGRQNSGINGLRSLLNQDSIKITSYIHLSNEFLAENKMDSSLWAAEYAKRLAETKKMPALAAWADYFIGSYFFYEGYYDEGIAIETKVVEKSNEIKNLLLSASANKLIAWMYTEMGRQEDALAIFKECLPVFKKFRNQDIQKSVGTCMYGIATAHFYLGNLDATKLYLDSALSVQPKMDVRETALALADRAAVHRNLNLLDNAKKDAMAAVNTLDEFPLQKDAIAYAEAELALTLAVLGEFKPANFWAIKSYNTYADIPLVKRYVSVYLTLTETFLKLNDYRRAFQTEHETRTLQDSIYKWRKLRVIDELRLKYESDKQALEIERLKLNQSEQESMLTQDRMLLLMLSCFILLGGLLTVVFFKKREKYHRRINALETANRIQNERQRIAKDLHDSLGTQLSTISIYLNQLRNHERSKIFTDIHELLERAISELRDSIWIMRTESISIGELEQRIHSLFWHYRKIECPIRFKLNVESSLGMHNLKPKQAGNIYRILQEATHNAVKHSKASFFEILISRKSKKITINICDDGVGFDVTNKIIDPGYGLRNMQARAKELNAEFEIHSRIGRGVQITLTF